MDTFQCAYIQPYFILLDHYQSNPCTKEKQFTPTTQKYILNEILTLPTIPNPRETMFGFS